MKDKKTVILIIIVLLLTLSACNKKNHNDGNTDVIVGEDKEPIISVERIGKYENMEISDWLDEEIVVLSKENDALDKMSLLELSEYYPRSLYLYNLNTKEYKLLEEEENLFLGGATLSHDKNHLLYYEFALGDLSYSVINIHTLDGFDIHGDNIGGATSAVWSGNEVVGTTYNNTVYLASSRGEITILEDIAEDIFIVRKIKDYIYYNTFYDQTLKKIQPKY